MEFRKLAKLTSEGPDLREVESYLQEIVSLMQIGKSYTELMISKIKGLSSVDPELVPIATKSFRSGSFCKSVQGISGFYEILEGFFMVENVRKAIRIDDVFYVLRSCLRRAISTSNISSVIAVLIRGGSLLSNECREALREQNLGEKLFLGGVGVQKTGTEIAGALNDVDVSSEYVLRLKHEIEDQCNEVFPAQADREKVKSCLSEFW